MQLLKVSRKSVYTFKEKKVVIEPLEQHVLNIFHGNYCVHGTRKIKVKMQKLGYQVSRRRIARIMRKYNLVSAYTRKKYRNHKTKVNEQLTANVINRQFNDPKPYEVIVSDLTYVQVGNQMNYICTLLDLHNREVIGRSCGKCKNPELVYQAFASVKQNLATIHYFHTDRGSEFDNYLIEEVLKVFNIKRSLSKKRMSL